MNCETVRDLLSERALGAPRDLGVERHLRGCAACRQEAAGLDRAAATLPFALAAVDAPDELEDRVVASVRGVARPAVPRRRARRRSSIAVVAATLALGVLIGGSVLADRPGPADPIAEAQAEQRGFENFQQILDQMEFGDAEARLGVLADPSGGPSRGSAMTIVGGAEDDRVLVMANGLVAPEGTLPYSVRLADGAGHYVWVGSVDGLTPTGGFTVARVIDEDLGTYVNVTVRDVHGRVVLSGSLSDQTSLPSPSS